MSPSSATTLLILSAPADVLTTGIVGTPHALLKPSCSSFAPAVGGTSNSHNNTTNGYLVESNSYSKYPTTTPEKKKFLLDSGIGKGNSIQPGFIKSDGKPPTSSSKFTSSSMTKNTKRFHHHHYHLPSPPSSSTLLLLDDGTGRSANSRRDNNYNKTTVTTNDDDGLFTSSPTIKSHKKIPTFYQIKQQQQQQQQQQDCLYNMMSMPPSLPQTTTSSPLPSPNTSPISNQRHKQRRFSISSMTTTNRALRDLAACDHHPNRFDQETSSSSYDKQQRKKNRNSLCHLPSSTRITDPAATTTIDYHKQKELRLSSSSRIITNDETNNQTSTNDKLTNVAIDNESSSSLYPNEANQTIKTTPTTIDHNIQTRTTIIPTKNHFKGADVFPLSKLRRQSSDYKIRTVSTEYDDDVVDTTKQHHNKKRRQSSIGISEQKQQTLGKQNKRRSLESSPSYPSLNNGVDRDTTTTSQEGKRIPSTQPILDETEANDDSSSTNDNDQQKQQQPRRRLFPKLPNADIIQIAPILSNTRKLIHEYTRQLDNNNTNNTNNSIAHEAILTKINTLTGYVVTPPVSEIIKNNSENDTSDTIQLHQRMELWNRVGPALKETEKFKNETAAAVEEVTQTRIEKNGNSKYQYYNLKHHNDNKKNSKKHNKCIDPKDYEARYNVMLEEVSAIRSLCWNKYFDELQIYNMNNLKPSTSSFTDAACSKQLHFSVIATDNIDDDDANHHGTVAVVEKHHCAIATTAATHMSQQQQQFEKTVTEESNFSSSSTKTNHTTTDDNETLMANNNNNNTDPATSDLRLKTEQERCDDQQLQEIEDDDDHNLLLSILPSRDLPSSINNDDPEIAQAEKQLWKELDEALDRYSQNVMNIMNKRKRDE